MATCTCTCSMVTHSMATCTADNHTALTCSSFESFSWLAVTYQNNPHHSYDTASALNSDYHEQANLLHEGLFTLGGAGERMSIVDCQRVRDGGGTVLVHVATTTVHSIIYWLALCVYSTIW